MKQNSISRILPRSARSLRSAYRLHAVVVGCALNVYEAI